jgi:hypothetical protein
MASVAAVRTVRPARDTGIVQAVRPIPVATRDDGGVRVSFEALYRRVDPADGERRLLLAVLEDGIRTLLKYATATRGRARRLQREALAWLLSDQQTDVVDYATNCEVLEIDPMRLRHRVLEKMRAAAPALALQGN